MSWKPITQIPNLQLADIRSKTVCQAFHLICAVPQFGVLLLKYHPESSECHEKAVAHIPKHHRKQEWKCNDGVECYRNTQKARHGGCCSSGTYSIPCVYACMHVGGVTWVDLSIAGYSVSIYNILEACSESVGGEEGRRRGASRQTIVEWIDTATALSLRNRERERERSNKFPLYTDTTRL